MIQLLTDVRASWRKHISKIGKTGCLSKDVEYMHRGLLVA